MKSPNNNNNYLLDIEGLSHQYGQFKALDQLTMKLQPGRIVGLLGPNGSGKTTLLKILAGLLSEYEGSVKIKGLSPGPRSKAVISYLPDLSYLNKRWTALDAMYFFDRYYEDFNMEKARSLLAHFKLEEMQRIDEMSKGMREKLQIVLVMGRDAEIYLLDEPISGVDPASREVVLDALIEGYSNDSLMLISTHLIQDIERLLDEVVFLDQGKMRLAGEAEALRAEYDKSIDGIFREVFRWSGN